MCNDNHRTKVFLYYETRFIENDVEFVTVVGTVNVAGLSSNVFPYQKAKSIVVINANA